MTLYKTSTITCQHISYCKSCSHCGLYPGWSRTGPLPCLCQQTKWKLCSYCTCILYSLVENYAVTVREHCIAWLTLYQNSVMPSQHIVNHAFMLCCIATLKSHQNRAKSCQYTTCKSRSYVWQTLYENSGTYQVSTNCTSYSYCGCTYIEAGHLYVKVGM